MLIYVKSTRFKHTLSLDMLIRRGKNKLSILGIIELSGPQQEDLSSGFLTMQDSNQPTQLQRLARMLEFCV